jgi:hypothetical protein
VTTLSTIHTAREDVAKVQAALGSVQGGLDAVETVAQTVEVARRGRGRMIKLGLLLAVVGVIAVVVASKRSKRNDETRP